MKRYLAFFDILGFKELVENNGIENLIKIYKETLDYSESHSFPIFEDEKFQNDGLELSSIIISDSILIWSKQNTTKCFMKVLMVARSFFLASLIKGLPLRGTIEVGELESFSRTPQNSTRDNHDYPILLGNALTKAYKIERNQNWAGCIVSNAAIESFEKNRKVESDIYCDKLIEQKIIAKYKVPLKQGNLQEYFVIDWVNITNQASLNKEMIRASFSKHNKPCDSWEVEEKIKNTIDFFESLKQQSSQ